MPISKCQTRSLRRWAPEGRSFLLFVIEPVRCVVAHLLGRRVAVALPPHGDPVDQRPAQDRDHDHVDDKPHPAAIVVHKFLLASTNPAWVLKLTPGPRLW